MNTFLVEKIVIEVPRRSLRDEEFDERNPLTWDDDRIGWDVDRFDDRLHDFDPQFIRQLLDRRDE